MIRFADDEYYEEVKRISGEPDPPGVQLESITTDGQKRYARPAALEVTVQRCDAHPQTSFRARIKKTGFTVDGYKDKK